MALLLALDAGSPTVSVAVGPPGEPRAERSVEIRRSSERLLALVDECLREVGAGARDLTGVIALRGPGSFTGLRVGLATALGLHQALELPAAAVPTLDVLALHGVRAAGLPPTATVVAAVDALRGEWFIQPFRAADGGPEPLGEPRIGPPADVPALEPAAVAGFGVGRMAEALAAEPSGAKAPGHAPDGTTFTTAWIEPQALAADALRLAGLRSPAWNGPELTEPLYLRPPAVSPPGR